MYYPAIRNHFTYLQNHIQNIQNHPFTLRCFPASIAACLSSSKPPLRLLSTQLLRFMDKLATD